MFYLPAATASHFLNHPALQNAGSLPASQGSGCLLWNMNGAACGLFVFCAFTICFLHTTEVECVAGLMRLFFFLLTFSGSSLDSCNAEESPCVCLELCGPVSPIVCVGGRWGSSSPAQTKAC